MEAPLEQEAPVPRPHRAPWIILGVAALAAALGLVAWNSGYLRLPIGDAEPEKMAAGFAAPDFERASLDGEQLSLRQFVGRPIVVDFWATWCAPCHIQARVLEPLVAEYRDRVTFLSVSMGEDPETVRKFFGAKRPPYPVLLDPTDSLSMRLGIHALPTMLVVGSDGKIVYFDAGIADEPTLRQALVAAGVA